MRTTPPLAIALVLALGSAVLAQDGEKKPVDNDFHKEVGRIARVVFNNNVKPEKAAAEIPKMQAMLDTYDVDSNPSSQGYAAEVMAMATYRGLHVREAIPHLQRMIELGQNVGHAHCTLAEAALIVGDLELSKKSLDWIVANPAQIKGRGWGDWAKGKLELLPRLGKKGNVISGKGPDGKRVSSAKKKGSVLLLAFWATW